VFPAVHHSYKFCLLTLRGYDAADFAFSLTLAEHLRDPRRRFSLSAADLALFNPNTHTCPVFRTRADADLARAIYQRVPVLVREGQPEGLPAGQAGNPWGISFQRMFDMSNNSHLFRTREQLEQDGFRLVSNVFVKGDPRSSHAIRYSPLYEAKLMHQFDHRFATYEGERMAYGAWKRAKPRRRKRPTRPLPSHPATGWQKRRCSRAWVADAVTRRRGRVIRRLTSALHSPLAAGLMPNFASDRQGTFLLSALPIAGAEDNVFLIWLPQSVPPQLCLVFLRCLNSLVFDYIVHQKLCGTNLSFFPIKLFLVLPPTFYTAEALTLLCSGCWNWFTRRKTCGRWPKRC
jgi:hypothetical protein